MNLIDLIIIALFGYGIIKGYNKGLIIELSSFFGIFISFFISTNLDDIISKQIVELVNINFDIVNIIVFILVFLLSYSAIIFIAKGFTKLIKFVYLGLLNSLLGSLFGGLKLLLILIILSKIIFSFSLIPLKSLSESVLIIQLHILSEIIFNSLEIVNYEYPNNLI
ncbi:MAG: CvpA family protein [Bacteroidota bacterium]|nr:CvpA family protein [Bacteroidota bacterium]|tara:strand:- start:3225 stop:3722 length:498 start_codon:yes stop_codon:yes gene_type:complete